MITRFCIICLCMTSSAMFGLLHVRRKKARVNYFASCEKLTEKLIIDISFRRENLCTILQEYAQEDETELKSQINRFCDCPYGKFVVTEKFLKSGEKQLVSDFFTSLGMCDASTQVNELHNFKKRFEAVYTEENGKFKKSGNVALKLSVLLGIAIGILIL